MDAVHRINEIKQRREGKYISHRLDASKLQDLLEAKNLKEKHFHLLRLPAADIEVIVQKINSICHLFGNKKCII